MAKKTFTMTPEILTAFGLEEDAAFSPIVSGHINDTFRISSETGSYIIQRINQYVFKSPGEIMENITSVTDFLKQKIEARNGDVARETLSVVKTVEGESFFLDAVGEYWRCVTYIDNATAYESVEDANMLREAGRAFGNFQNMLSDFPADTLRVIIPDFHNTPERFRQLTQAMEKNAAERLDSVATDIEFALERRDSCGLLMQLLGEGKLPLRVTHNDTKMSNVLIDDATGTAVCVIDLDTVMPGLTAFDFGDSIRAGATTAAEDESDLSKVWFSLRLFEAYTEGFLSAAGDSLTETELRTLPDGAIWMTFEVGIRFLADYLNGDVYFRTEYPEHNLVRARNQFKLVADMERKRPEMDAIVSKFSHSKPEADR